MPEPRMNGRAIKQIAVAESANEEGDSRCIVALCEDNSVWAFTSDGSVAGKWHRLPPIPSDDT